MSALVFDRVKYRVVKTVSFPIPFPWPKGLNTGELVSPLRLARLTPAGDGRSQIEIFRGFSWDGASGPCPDKGVRLASAVHDALYSIMRSGELSREHEPAADRCCYLMAKQSVPSWWAWIIWKALTLFGCRALRHPRPTRSIRIDSSAPPPHEQA